MLTSRERLIQTILRLGDNQIDRLSGLVDSMEYDDLSPPCIAQPSWEKQDSSGFRLQPAKDWPHAPTHQLTKDGTYIVTGGTFHKQHLFARPVRVANQYRWCSAAWLERTATRAQVRTIYSFKTERVNVLDDFDPIVLAECG